MKKYKNMFNNKVIERSVCAKYAGKALIPTRNIWEKNDSFLKLKSLNVSTINKILKRNNKGVSKNGVIIVSKKRSNINIRADKDRNLRSSNTKNTYHFYSQDLITQNETISVCFSFCKLSTEIIILSVNSCISSLQT